MTGWRSHSFALAAVVCLAASCAPRSGTQDAAAGGATRPVTQPFGGKPHAIPGVVEAEHFDEGAEGASHHDLDPQNQGAPYRKTSVDVEARPDASNGHGIGWTRGGEWLVYTVSVAEAGSYSLEVPVASAKTGGTFHLEFDGKDVTGPISVPDTGGWQKLQVIRKGGVVLPAGVHTLRLSLDRDGESGSVADIDLFRFQRER